MLQAIVLAVAAQAVVLGFHEEEQFVEPRLHVLPTAVKLAVAKSCPLASYLLISLAAVARLLVDFQATKLAIEAHQVFHNLSLMDAHAVVEPNQNTPQEANGSAAEHHLRPLPHELSTLEIFLLQIMVPEAAKFAAGEQQDLDSFPEEQAHGAMTHLHLVHPADIALGTYEVALLMNWLAVVPAAAY